MSNLRPPYLKIGLNKKRAWKQELTLAISTTSHDGDERRLQPFIRMAHSQIELGFDDAQLRAPSSTSVPSVGDLFLANTAPGFKTRSSSPTTRVLSEI